MCITEIADTESADAGARLCQHFEELKRLNFWTVLP
jgi:hypothetical protein